MEARKLAKEGWMHQVYDFCGLMLVQTVMQPLKIL